MRDILEWVLGLVLIALLFGALYECLSSTPPSYWDDQQ